MFNTMTVTKAAGAVIGALLFLLLTSWLASSLYHVGFSGHVAEGEEIPQAYRVAVEDAAGGEAAGEAPAADAGPDFATVLASADAAAGEKVFGKCKACHKIDGTDGTGPHLNGVVDRSVGSIEGFKYSDAMKGHGGNWDAETLQTYLADPKGAVPGNKMAFAGLKKVEDRANLIAYLQTLN